MPASLLAVSASGCVSPVNQVAQHRGAQQVQPVIRHDKAAGQRRNLDRRACYQSPSLLLPLFLALLSVQLA